MKLLPVSLAARTVLLVIAVIAVAEVTTFSLVGHFRKNAHMAQTAQFVGGQVRLLQEVLPGLEAAARRRLAAGDGSEHGMQLRPDSAAVPQHEPRFGFARRLAGELSERLGEPVQLRHAGPGQRSGLWIGFLAAGERWWLVLPPPRFEPQALPADMWLGLAVALLVLLGIAALFVRGIVGPLARLGAAVSAAGDGAAAEVKPEGPLEVRRLAERHNTMLAQLAAAAAERREMLAGLTHDLRAPLARLRVRLALLENDAERAGLTRDTEDMERIVSQCLAFLRSDSAVGEVPPLRIADALREQIERYRELGQAVTLNISEEAASGKVALSAGNLQRLLDNLLDNARQHAAPPFEVALRVEGGTHLCLRVRDHGPGIAPAQREQAIEAFAQLEPARATGGSCGLGLAIVRRLVSACGGTLTLEEAVGGGLEVVVCLPLV